MEGMRRNTLRVKQLSFKKKKKKLYLHLVVNKLIVCFHITFNLTGLRKKLGILFKIILKCFLSTKFNSIKNNH